MRDSNNENQSNNNNQREFIELFKNANEFDKRKYNQSKTYIVRSNKQLIALRDLK